MKKVIFILGIIVACIVLYVFVNKLYYPALPIDGVSAKEAIDQLNESNSKVAKLAVEKQTIWYITSSENQGILIADENIKQLLASNGWEFKEKDGGGLFFEKGEERLIVSTKMWTKKYVLFKVQGHF